MAALYTGRAAIIALGVALHVFRISMLVEVGQVLALAGSAPHADILLVMRGDETRFERPLTAAAPHNWWTSRYTAVTVLVSRFRSSPGFAAPAVTL